MPRQRFHLAVLCLLLLDVVVLSQTFEISPSGGAPSKSTKKNSKAAPRQAAPSAENGIGWGSGIEVARDARAAQRALQKNDYSAAVNYATRAAKSRSVVPSRLFRTNGWPLPGFA